MTSAELRGNRKFWESKVKSKVESKIEIVSLLHFLTPPISLGRETREKLRKNEFDVSRFACVQE